MIEQFDDSDNSRSDSFPHKYVKSMTKLLKLIERFLSEPPEIKFLEVNTLLEAFGFREIRSTGSHHIFRNDQGQNLVVPKTGGKMVKRTYIKQIIRLLDLEIWYAEHKNTK